MLFLDEGENPSLFTTHGGLINLTKRLYCVLKLSKGFWILIRITIVNLYKHLLSTIKCLLLYFCKKHRSNDLFCVIIGGTIFGIIPNIPPHDLIVTIVMAFVGALVSFLASMLFKTLAKFFKKYE